jgi:hypothetical protein
VKSSYGYTGNGQSSNSVAKMMMAGAAGAAVGGVLAFGGYYAYNRYQEGKLTASAAGVDTTWCRVPNTYNGQTQSQAGKLIQCNDCQRAYGVGGCRNEDSCYQAGGCDYVLPTNTYRDDLMATGFVPSTYTSPIRIKIWNISGADFLASNICPKNNNFNVTTDFNLFVANSVVAPDLFVTLAEQSVLFTGCDPDTRQPCTTNTQCTGYTHARCVLNGASAYCECDTGYCYNTGTQTCTQDPKAAADAHGQFMSPWVLLLALCVSVRALKRWI